VYDPLDTRPGELESSADTDSLTDQRFELRLNGNGLVYHDAAHLSFLELPMIR
jgi:hypothetical protein